MRWSDASFVQDQDQWWHAGISRSVTLAAQGSVRDVFARADADGSLVVDVDGGEVEAQLVDPRGRVVLRRRFAGRLETGIRRPRLWSAEEPSLYTLLLDDGTARSRAGSASGRSRSATGSCSSTARRR